MRKIREVIIRKLAKSYKYQTLYARAKELSNFSLFNNEKDLSRLQVIFLDWLEAYRVLYTDLALDEKYISKEVIEDDLRAEAYLFWKATKKEKLTDREDKNVKVTPQDVPKIIFNEKRK